MEERQQLHSLRFIQSAKPRPQEGDWTYHDGVMFMTDPKTPASEITLREGTFVLVRGEKAPMVMQVLAILEKRMRKGEARQKCKGEARLRTRTGVLPAGLAAPSMLSRARAKYPRQVFWRVDGGEYYSGDLEKGTIKWSRVLAVCSVVHRRSLAEDDMQAYEEPLPTIGTPSQSTLWNGQRFFYSKSLDVAKCFRTEDFCLPCDEQYKSAPIRKEAPLVMMDVCCGVGGVTMGANMLNEAVREGAKGEPTAEGRQINVEYAVEEDGRVRNAYVQNAHQGNAIAGTGQKICKSITVKQCLNGIQQQAKDGMEPAYGTAPRKGEVDILHMSPPCQSMSKVNMHANLATIKKEMFPLLDQCVEMARELEPNFVTVEEVPTFLIHTVKEDKGGSKEQEASFHSWPIAFQ
ncbi:hypothetical protein COCOBI_06-5990 [Coccomyxa sp. Obi]|nr:hypothetical protein COCOBI_06-5990 [Coccomyxa sp. Obi]